LEDIERELAVRLARKAFLRYALYPVAVLALMLTVPFPLYYFRFFSYTTIMPDVLVFSGIGVIFFGAFYDFGAKQYVREIIDNKLPLTEEDMDYIYKQQFKLTAIYAGIGGLYILSGVMVFLF